MQQDNGGAAVAAALEHIGVDTIFGVPSQHNLALYDAIARRGKIRLVGSRHEAGAVHQADGYARATGKLGVAITSTGPGTANAVNGLYEAQFASSPVLLITTQVDRKYLGSQKAFIHDAPHQSAMLQSVSRTVHSPRHANQLASAILQAAAEIQSGRPQPSVVEIPTDLLSSPCHLEPLKALPKFADIFPEAEFAQLTAALQEAKKPLLWIGGGCTQAGETGLVQAFAERFQIPVLSSQNGRAAMPTNHPLHLGSTTHYPQLQSLLQESDLVLAVGTRFQAVATWFWSVDLHGKLIHVDIEPAIIGRNYRPNLAFTADASDLFTRLLEQEHKPDVAPDFLLLAQSVKSAMIADHDARIGPFHQAICEAVDRILPQDKIIVCDATMTGNSWGSHKLPVHRPRGFMYSTSLAIGPALPLGIGAAIGSGKTTLIIHGDGGVMLNIGELATAVEAKAPIILLVFNDKGYGVLRTLQRMNNVPEVGVDLHTPDFQALGQSMGMASDRVSTPDAFAAALKAASERSGPNLIEIDLSNVEAPKL